jgi:hypothetical protein
MHRVYNSAFMHMLRDEDNAGYRKVMRDTLEFDPEILKRYVNFMTNPDEETAIEQFSTGDKAFGVATLLATLPGLPMIGHGQVEAFTEKYGMEFRRARLDEQPTDWHIDRFEREIAPLLHHRGRFAEATDFRLYDVVADDGRVLEDVYAYSNGGGGQRSLIVYHNRFASAAGWIRDSVPFAVKDDRGMKSTRHDTLGTALGVVPDDAVFLAFRDGRAGREYLRPSREIAERGLFVELDAYRCLVFTDFWELHDSADSPWRQLAERLAGSGVPSLEDALTDLRLAPVHDAFAALLDDLTTTERDRRHAAFRAAAGLERAEPPTSPAAGDISPTTAIAIALQPLATTDFDRLRLAMPLRSRGLSDDEIERVRTALAVVSTSDIRDASRLADAWLADPDIRRFLEVNTWENVEWFGKGAFERLLTIAEELRRVGGAKRRPAALRELSKAAASAGYRVDRFVEALRGASPARGARKSPSPASASRSPRRRRS